jgi:hypothetical protein
MSGEATVESVQQAGRSSAPPRPGARITFRVHVRRARVSAFQAMRRLWAAFKRQVWSSLGPVLAITLLVLAVAAFLGILLRILGTDWWSSANDACHAKEFGCHLASEAIMYVVFGGLGAWVFLGGEAAAAMSWRKTVKREPEWLFRGWISNLDGLTGAAARAAPMERHRRRPRIWRLRTDHKERPANETPVRKTAVGREQLARSVIADLNESHDPQILVGESGAGKTVLLMVIADRLARQSQVPIAITLRDGSAADIEESAKRAFMDAVTGATNFRRAWFRRARAKNDEQAEKWWNWLRQRSLITVLVDDFEKDTELDPARRVQALEGAAHQHLRLVVTSRSYGLPPDYRRGRVDVDRIDDDDIIDDLQEIARAPGAEERDPHDARPGAIRALVQSADRRRPPRGIERLPDTRIDAEAPPTDAQIGDLVKDADIGRTPYYLAVARVLADRELFPTLADTRNARVALLDNYFKGLQNGRLSSTSGLSDQTRAAVLGQLEVVAYVCVFAASEERKELEIAQKARALRRTSDALSYQEGFDLARRLTVLESRYDGTVHFAHPTTLAYFASRYLRDDWGRTQKVWGALSEQAHLSPIAINALTLAVAGDTDMVVRGCDELLNRVDSTASDPARVDAGEYNREPLALCAAAAEMLATLEHPDAELIRRISRAARAVSVVGQRLTAEKKRVVTALSRLAAYEEIWHYARDHQEYPVRREASRLLAHERDAHTTLIRELEDRIKEAERASRSGPPLPDDNSDLLVELKAVAWIFPSVRMAANKSPGPSPSYEALEDLQKRLIKLSLEEELTVQRGLEASVAQGLKLAAQENRGQADHHAQEMLDSKPAFWFSRVMLAQALALQAVGTTDAPTPPGDRREIRRRLRQLEREDAHPFVRQTAWLCRRALARPSLDGSVRTRVRRISQRQAARRPGTRPERWESYIWADAADVVTGVPQRLSVKAAQLAGDIIIALNLNAAQDSELRRGFGTAKALPACLSPKGTRQAILGQADPPLTCPLHVRTETQIERGEPGHCACPYLYSSTDLGRTMEARREVSRAFCRHQMVNARPPVWQHTLKVKELRTFWEHMGELARF